MNVGGTMGYVKYVITYARTKKIKITFNIFSLSFARHFEKKCYYILFINK